MGLKRTARDWAETNSGVKTPTMQTCLSKQTTTEKVSLQQHFIVGDLLSSRKSYIIKHIFLGFLKSTYP